MDLNLTSTPPEPPSDAEAAWLPGFSWEEARGAVEDHESGGFRWSSMLALQSKRYSPIKAAAKQRKASPCGLPWSVSGPDRAPGRLETEACDALWKQQIARLLPSILDDIAFLGFSVIVHPTAVDEEGRRYIVSVDRWPLGAVAYTETEQRGVKGYYARTKTGEYIQLPRPGETDGLFTVIGYGDRPHLDGAVTALDLQYVAGQVLERARANLGTTMGRASPVIEMPQETPSESAEGKSAQKVVQGLGTKKAAAVLFGGAKLNKFELGTSTYTFFEGALRDRITMVELALLGRGGTTAKPDAQYQPATGIEMNVPEDLVRADVRTVEMSVGALFALLAALNAALPPEKAPKLSGNMPDTDQAAKKDAEQKQRAADDAHAAAQLAAMKLAADALAAERTAGMLVDQARIEAVYGIAGVPAPVLPSPVPPQNVAAPVATAPQPSPKPAAA